MAVGSGLCACLHSRAGPGRARDTGPTAGQGRGVSGPSPPSCAPARGLLSGPLGRPSLPWVPVGSDPAPESGSIRWASVRCPGLRRLCGPRGEALGEVPSLAHRARGGQKFYLPRGQVLPPPRAFWLGRGNAAAVGSWAGAGQQAGEEEGRGGVASPAREGAAGEGRGDQGSG